MRDLWLLFLILLHCAQISFLSHSMHRRESSRIFRMAPPPIIVIIAQPPPRSSRQGRVHTTLGTPLATTQNTLTQNLDAPLLPHRRGHGRPCQQCPRCAASRAQRSVRRKMIAIAPCTATSPPATRALTKPRLTSRRRHSQGKRRSRTCLR